MTKFLSVAATAAFFAAGGGWILMQGASPLSPLPGAAVAQEAGEVDISTIVDMVQGDADAPVEVIEYASYTCPHCANFHANQYEELKANYIDTGKIRFVYREIYFDRFGLWASMMARCGGETQFFGITGLLYEQQREWLAGGQDPALIGENLRRIGLTAGIDAEQLDACMADATMAQTLVAWFEENSTQHGVTSTPSFVIDGQLYTNMGYDEFADVLDAALGE